MTQYSRSEQKISKLLFWLVLTFQIPVIVIGTSMSYAGDISYSRVNGLSVIESPTAIFTNNGKLIGDHFLCEDDTESALVPLGFRTSDGDYISVSSNGYVALGNSSTSYPRFGIFAADLDSRINTGNCDSTLTSNFVVYGQTTYEEKPAFAVTWYKVQPWEDPRSADVIGTFQVIIVGLGNYQYKVVRNYETIQSSISLYGFYGAPYLFGIDSLWITSDTATSKAALIDGGSSSLSQHSLNSAVPGRYISEILGHPIAPSTNCNNLAGNLSDTSTTSTITSNNNILNSDFEFGVNSYGKYNFGGGEVDVPWNFVNPYADSKFEWMTSDSNHELEIWHLEKNGEGKTDFKNADHVNAISGMEPYSGKNWAELGANSEGVLYQDVVTVPGSTFTYTFAHHGRDSSDTMRLSIGAKPTNVNVPPSPHFGISTNSEVLSGLEWQTPSLRASRQNSSDTSGGGVFTAYSGSSYLTDSTGDKWGVYRGTYVVPAGQTCTRFAFSYVNGFSPSIGNFLDGVKFSRAIDDEYENYSPSQELHILINDNNLIKVTKLLNSNLESLPISETNTSQFVTSLGGFVETTTANTVLYFRPPGIQSGTDILYYEAEDSNGNKYTASVLVNLHPIFTIKFFAMGGNFPGGASDPQTNPSVPYGTNALSISPLNPSKTGSVFMGWTLSSDTSTVLTEYAVSSNKDFEAKWGTGYNVYYHANGGTYPGGAPDNQTMYGAQYGSNALVAPPANPSKSGYVFLGWAERSESTTVITAYPIKGDVDIDAVWGMGYTVNFFANGGAYPGNAPDPQSAFDVPIGWHPFEHAPANPTKPHSNFMGWALSTDTATVINSYSIPGNTDLYAVWNLKNSYTFAYSAGSGGAISGSANQTVFQSESGTAVTANPNSGYRFIKWSDNSNVNPRTDTNAIGNLTLTAIFELIPPPPSGGGGGGGGAPVERQKVDPEINWSPTNINEGESISDLQLNATFSVPGTSVYSPPVGFKPEVGSLSISVSFTPNNLADYNVISVARTIEVFKKVAPTPTPTPTPKPSPTVTASPKPTASPIPSPTPKPTPSSSPSPRPIKQPVAKATPKPSPSKTPSVSKPSAKPVIKPTPVVAPTPPTFGVGRKDLIVKDLNQGQRIRVKISDLNGKDSASIPETTTAKSSTTNTKQKSAVSIDITPTIDSTLKKGAQIAVDGAKKNQRVRVSVK